MGIFHPDEIHFKQNQGKYLPVTGSDCGYLRGAISNIMSTYLANILSQTTISGIPLGFKPLVPKPPNNDPFRSTRMNVFSGAHIEIIYLNPKSNSYVALRIFMQDDPTLLHFSGGWAKNPYQSSDGYDRSMVHMSFIILSSLLLDIDFIEYGWSDS